RDRLDAPDLRLLDDHAVVVVVLPQVLDDVAEHTSDPAEVLAGADLDVEHGPRPVLAHVADPEELAVAEVPDGAVGVPHSRDAQADRPDRARQALAHVDDVADAVLALEDHEDPDREVLDQVRRAEAQGDTAI